MGWLRKAKNFRRLWCSLCGDETKAAKPVTVILWDGLPVELLLCLSCADELKGNRKVAAANLLNHLKS